MMIGKTIQFNNHREDQTQVEIRSNCFFPFLRKSSQKANHEAGSMERLPIYLEYLRELIGSCPNH